MYLTEMKHEITSIIENFQEVMQGNPWFGRSVYAVLDDVNPANAHKKTRGDAHTMAELLYHMLTWSAFTLARLNGDKDMDLDTSEELDWREIDPGEHTWEQGLADYKKTYQLIIAALQKKDDKFLDTTVDFRSYDFRFLLNGLVQHNIYHLGQISYIRTLQG